MASSAALADTKKSHQPDYGGYDYEFVNSIPDKCICSICAKVLREAHLVVCCGKHFCASCLTHWLGTQQRKKTCPHCRQEDFQHVPNKERIKDVNELKIRCTNHSEGCEWVGELGGLRSHLDSDKGCGYVEVTCTKEGCGERVSRKDFQTHLEEKCYYRPYECKHCGHKDTYTAITGKKSGGYYLSTYLGGHYKDCPGYPLDCPNRCGVTGIRRRAMPDHRSSCPLEPLNCPNKGCRERVNRKDLQTHLQKQCDSLPCPNRCGVTGIRRRAMPDHHSSCPLEPLDCPFKDAGCTKKIARKDMEDHMTANQQKHMLLSFQSLQQANQQVKQDLVDTKRKLWITQQELHNIQHSADGLRKIGDTLTFRVTDFPRLRKEKEVWQSPSFSIGDKVRIRLLVHPCGIESGQGSHVSVSLVLMEVLQKQDMWLMYTVTIAATGQHRSVPLKTLELCTYYSEKGDDEKHKLPRYHPSFRSTDEVPTSWSKELYMAKRKLQQCSAHFPLPSPGEVLRSKELFLEIEEASSLLQNDAMILELKLLEHEHHRPCHTQ